MKRPFNPEPKQTTYKGSPVYEVDCRQWTGQMRALSHPVRRRFLTKGEAQAWCRQLVVDSTVGRKLDPGPVALSSLCDLFQKSIEAGAAMETIKTYRSQKRKFIAFLERHNVVDVREVTPAVVEMYRADLFSEDLRSNTIIGYLSWLSKMYRWANRTGYGVGNPVDGVKMPKRESRRRNFTEDELRTLMAGADPELKPLWTLLLLTGLRRREAVELLRDNVVIETPAPFLRVVGKGKKVRTIPLVPEAQEAVRHFLGVHDCDTLLPFTYREIYVLWAGESGRKIVGERARLGLPDDLDVHSFRHTFLTWLANRTGTPLTAVQAVAGHASVVTTTLYVHRDESMLRKGMGRLGADMVSVWYQEDAANEKIQRTAVVTRPGA